MHEDLYSVAESEPVERKLFAEAGAIYFEEPFDNQS
jgi:hypothetical protein